jgi:alcohol dehydrogenase
MKMRATVLREIAVPPPYATSQPILIEELDLDAPGPGELLVKVIGAGLCHSDLSVINGSRPRPLPVVLGHEGAGEVVEVGAGVRDIAVGDPVVFQFSASCGRCVRCLEGRPQICETHAVARAKGELMGAGKRLHDAGGNEVNHQTGVSCFAEYAVVDRGSVVRIDADIPLETAAIFGCAVMTGVGAALNAARVAPGDRVAVIGLGGVGFSAMLGAILGGAAQVIAVDVNPAKLGLARQLGAHHTIDARDADHVEQIKDLTGGGVDTALEGAGVIPALKTGYDILRSGGQLVTVGLSPQGDSFPIPAADLVTREIAVRGSYMGSCVPVRDIPRYLEAFRQGRLPVDRLIGEHVGFEAINEGFDKLASGDAVRRILTPHAG